MKEYQTDKLRNLALVGHQGAGKTSLAEAMLFNTGALNRLGNVMDGTTVSDYDEDEQERGISLNVTLVPCEMNDHKINVLDTPGYTDFAGEVISAIHAADAALVLIDAVAGVEVGTELTWSYADRYNLPRFLVINKMDRDNARFETAMENLRANIPHVRFLPLQLPVGAQHDFSGVVDLVTMKIRSGAGDAPTDPPADMADAIEAARLEVIESAAENDEELMNKYFETETLSEAEIRKGLRIGIQDGSIVPVFVVASTANTGIKPLMEAIIEFFPNPAGLPPVEATGLDGEREMLTSSDDGPLAAYVFKSTADRFVGTLTYFRVFSGMLKADTRYFNASKQTEERFGTLNVMRGNEQIPVETLHAGDIGAVAKLGHTNTGDTICDKGHPLQTVAPEYPYPIYAVAVVPRTQADATKMGSTLTVLCDSDPTLQWHQEASTRQSILEGMGELHIATNIKRAERFGTNLDTKIPKVPYRETITKVNAAQYRHKKQTGGAGQFAEVHLRLEPVERGAGFEFANEIFGGAISGAFVASTEKGVRQVLDQGVIAGFPVVDVKAVVYDGKEHPVDSKDIAFQIAGREAFKQAFNGAGPVLLEPIMNVEVTVPESNMGDVLSDLNTRRGRVQGMDTQANKSIVTAQVPLAEMQRYSNDLRSFTQGRGTYGMEFSHYEQVPAHLLPEIIEAAKKERAEQE
ncbi:MAG: elongation factor G [Anaerolineae bacterium]|nr:elongation factor G [Anaerolineae bacterium]